MIFCSYKQPGKGETITAGTFSQIYIQCVLAVKGRKNLIQKTWREYIYKYMAGIIKNKGQKPIIINGVEDHVHLFIGLKPSMAISDLMRDVSRKQIYLLPPRSF